MSVKNPDLNQATGQRIRMLRKMLGLSQAQLASRLDFSYQQLQKYETGQNNISLNMLMNISKGLDVTLGDLINLNEADSASSNEAGVSHEAAREQVYSNKIYELLESVGTLDDPELQSAVLKLIHAITAVKAETKTS